MSSEVTAKYALILAAIVIYLFFSLTYLELPGLYYDEVLFANAAMGNIDGTFVEWEMKVGDKRIPLMLMRYIGAVKAYLYAPIFALFGASATTVRLPVLLVGLLALLLTYAVVKSMLGEKVALVALLLLASDPTFIFANKLDWGPVSLMMALKMSSLYLLLSWLSKGGLYLLGSACFLLGLGVYDKIIFAWYVAAIVLALPLFFWRKLKSILSWRSAAVAVLCFALGCSPLLAYNLKFSGLTFEGQKVLNTSPMKELADRIYVLRATLNGSAVYGYINGEDLSGFKELLGRGSQDELEHFIGALAGLLPLNGTLMPQALTLAIGAILMLWVFEHLKPKANVLFFLSLFVLINVFIYVTAQATGPHHVIMAYPFHHVLVAFAICELARALGGAPSWARGSARLASVACAIALMLAQLIIDARYLKSFAVKGGVGMWSDAIYELARYAQEHSDKKFVLMDWGFSNQLLVLTRGRIKKEEAFVAVKDAQEDREKMAAMYQHLTGSGSVLAFHAPGYESFPTLDVFKRALEKYGLEARVIKTFYQRDGRPVYLLYEVLRPEVEAYVKSGRFFYMREAEQWDAKSGGDIDHKQGASQGTALGSYWGAKASHFVAYRFAAPRRLSSVHLYLKYAFENPEPQRYYLFLDDNLIEILKLETTGGFGYIPEEWKIAKIKIGLVEPGPHELKIKPAADHQVMNLDYFYLCEGSCDLKPN